MATAIIHESSCCDGCFEQGHKEGFEEGNDDKADDIKAAYDDGYADCEDAFERDDPVVLFIDQVLAVCDYYAGTRECPRCNFPSGSRPESCLVCKMTLEFTERAC